MKRAEWAGAVLAESDDIVMVEGNAYFPEAAVRREHFVPSDKTTFCPWKGTANYYSVRVDGQTNESAAWYYAEPKAAARQIAGRVVFARRHRTRLLARQFFTHWHEKCVLSSASAMTGRGGL